MSKPLLKKEIAAMSGQSPRTLRRHPQQWRWLEQCRTRCAGRPTYNRARVEEGLRRRRII